MSRLPMNDGLVGVGLELRRQKLLEAAEILRQGGWCQGLLETADGMAFCAAGAIYEAHDREDPAGVEVWDPDAAIALMDDYLKSTGWKRSDADRYARLTPVWNDSPGRTKEEVIGALETAAFFDLGGDYGEQ